MTPHDSPRLIADIGGSFARFVLETAPGQFSHPASLRCDAHADFPSAVRAYLAGLPGLPGPGDPPDPHHPPPGRSVVHVAVAIANPVEGDRVRMTNYPWAFSIEQVRQQLGLQTLLVVNDFTALAMSLPRLAASDWRQVGGGQAVPDSVVGLIGAGTGMGMSGLVPAGDSRVSLGSEGGHTSFAPMDERELVVLRHAWTRFGHVSFERLLSGAGLGLIHRALSEHAGLPEPALDAPEITRRALAGECAACVDTLDVFCGVLGTAASNLALTLGARGGIYIGGGIVPRLGAYFDRSPFRARFESKGRFSGYLAAIPTRLIVAGQATLSGAAAILDSQLRALKSAPAAALLQQIAQACDTLSPAERRVAELVLAQPGAVPGQPIAAIARAAQVSQPTVIRFCRSLGCQGLSDFKLRLASGLTGTVPLTHVQVNNDSPMAALGSTVLGNAASAIRQLSGRLDHTMIDRTIDLLAGAGRVEFYATARHGAVAQDAQLKFLQLGIPSAACTDPARQALAAAVLRPGDVAVLISHGGRRPELLDVADHARRRGAAVVALTTRRSPLARQADTVLALDPADGLADPVPTVHRILQGLMLDILAAGVAARVAAGEAARLAARVVPAADR